MVDYVKPRKDYKNRKSIREYVYKVRGKYQIIKGKVYYGRYNTREDARKVSKELEKLGWDKKNLKKAQENAGVKASSYYWNNTSGYAHVTKQKDNRVKQGYLWVYAYNDDGKKRIYDKTLDGLEKRVKDMELEWREL